MRVARETKNESFKFHFELQRAYFALHRSDLGFFPIFVMVILLTTNVLSGLLTRHYQGGVVWKYWLQKRGKLQMKDYFWLASVLAEYWKESIRDERK